jgi:hypothetical protein
LLYVRTEAKALFFEDVDTRRLVTSEQCLFEARFGLLFTHTPTFMLLRAIFVVSAR